MNRRNYLNFFFKITVNFSNCFILLKAGKISVKYIILLAFVFAKEATEQNMQVTLTGEYELLCIFTIAVKEPLFKNNKFFHIYLNELPS